VAWYLNTRTGVRWDVDPVTEQQIVAHPDFEPCDRPAANTSTAAAAAVATTTHQAPGDVVEEASAVLAATGGGTEETPAAAKAGGTTTTGGETPLANREPDQPTPVLRRRPRR